MYSSALHVNNGPVAFPVLPLAQEASANKTDPLLKASLQEPVQTAKVSLPAKVTQISQSFLSLFKDAQLMELIANFLGIASNIITLSDASSKAVPVLGMLGSPWFLYHALSDSKKRVHLMVLSWKTKRTADIFFWGGKAVESFGSTVSAILQPIAGCAELKGLMRSPALGLVFTSILPIILIVFGAIGGSLQAWSTVRTSKALNRLQRQAASVKNLQTLTVLLKSLQGSKIAGTAAAVEDQNFQEVFTSLKRKEAIQQDIKRFFTPLKGKMPQFEMLSSFISKEPKEPVLEASELLHRIQNLQERLIDPEFVDFGCVDKALELYSYFIQLFENNKVALFENSAEGDALIQKLKEESESLNQWGCELFSEGMENIEAMKSELHRKLSYHAVFLLMAALTFSSGILLIAAPHCRILANALALAGSGLGIMYVLFDKKVSKENFLQFERYLGTIQKRKLAYHPN